MAPNITKRREADIMHLPIEEYNTIYEIFLPKVEPECNQAFRCNAQKIQKTDKSMGIQLSKKVCNFLKYEENI